MPYTEPTTTNATSRRFLFGGAAALLSVAKNEPAAAAATPNPDAALIALCAAYVAKDREYCSIGQHTWDMKVSDPEWVRCHELGCAIVPGLRAMEQEITDTPARSLPGLWAKAEAARHQLSGDADRDPEPMDLENALVWSLLQEILTVLGRA